MQNLHAPSTEATPNLSETLWNVLSWKYESSESHTPFACTPVSQPLIPSAPQPSPGILWDLPVCGNSPRQGEGTEVPAAEGWHWPAKGWHGHASSNPSTSSRCLPAPWASQPKMEFLHSWNTWWRLSMLTIIPPALCRCRAGSLRTQLYSG